MKHHYEIIMLTNQCNMNCSYCYQTKKNSLYLPVPILEKRLTSLKEKIDCGEIEKLNINLFGGEPLLNWDGFRFVVEFFSNYDNVSISTITNGTLLDEDRVKILSKVKNFSIDVSIDGSFESNRQRTDDFDVYENVLQNINLISSYHIPLNLRITVTNHNFRYILSDIVSFGKIPGIECIILQFANYDGIKVPKKMIQKIFPVLDQIRQRIMIDMMGCVVDKIDLHSILFVDDMLAPSDDLWHVFQTNGLIYSTLACLPTGAEDYDQFLFDQDTDFYQYNIHSVLDLYHDTETIFKSKQELMEIRGECQCVQN